MIIKSLEELRQPDDLTLRFTSLGFATGGALRPEDLDSLLRWARAEGLLRGQRNRRLEPVLKKFRNHVAHGTGGHPVMPVDSARTISDVGEITNHLWGSPTPGGRLYPAPIRREIQTVAWSPEG